MKVSKVGDNESGDRCGQWPMNLVRWANPVLKNHPGVITIASPFHRTCLRLPGLSPSKHFPPFLSTLQTVFSLQWKDVWNIPLHKREGSVLGVCNVHTPHTHHYTPRCSKLVINTHLSFTPENWRYRGLYLWKTYNVTLLPRGRKAELPIEWENTLSPRNRNTCQSAILSCFRQIWTGKPANKTYLCRRFSPMLARIVLGLSDTVFRPHLA